MDYKKHDLLKVENLKKYYFEKNSLIGKNVRTVRAVDDISLDVFKGETLGLVGESGCGKSTLGRSILYLDPPTDGKVIYDGQDLSSFSAEQVRQIRKKIQMIFQDPYASLNPKMTVFDSICAPLKVFNIGSEGEQVAKVKTMMERVGLSEYCMHKYPHEFSGGQRQRIVIARALILNPELVVCDEPVSALDVSVRSQVINMMRELQKELELTYIFISHDLSVVKYVSDRIAVMYLGKIVEMAATEDLFINPMHFYTRALMSAILVPGEKDRKRIVLTGDVPSPVNVPKGCRFHTRCTHACEKCKVEEPQLKEITAGHFVACHLA